MKILVIGYTNAGKDTASVMLAKLIGSPPPMACSDIIIRDFAKAANSCELCIRRNKGQYRVGLYEYGKERQMEDPCYPAPEILSRTNVLNGIRTRKQYLACGALFDLIVWIDRPGYGPGKTDELRPGHADVRVVNDGTLVELRDRLEEVLAAWGSRHER